MDSIAFHPSLQLSSSISKTSVTDRNTNTRSLHLRAVAVPNTHPWKKISNRRSTKSDLQCSSSSSSSSSVQYGVQVQEGPSCIFVGPLETATKDMLEALYQQISCCPFVVMGENVGPFSAPVSDARDSYYSGRPLILDDMFDKVELKLRWYRSKSVVKYPRCSLKRQSTYADAEVDPSQTWALASIWISLLVIGMTAFIVPPVCTLSEVCKDALNMQLAPRSSTLALESLAVANIILAIALGSSIGYPITVASVRALQGLWRNDLVALKGSCPGCGEEVFAFVRADESVRPRHKTECHVCQRPLVFHARVEHSMSNPGSRWLYGRVYLVARIKDLSPRSSSLTDRSPQE